MPKTNHRTTKKRPAVIRDKHLLYTAAVQSVEADIEFFERVYRTKRGGRFVRFREDFCGTAALACEWVRRRGDALAWGIDLDRATLDWGKHRYVSTLGTAAERLELICGNVLAATKPKVDVVAALNFSYSVFKTREELGRYFRTVRRSLRPGGIFFIDAFGGTDAIHEDTEQRRIDASEAFDGTRIPAFTYVWDQRRFNPIDHHIECRIHFRLTNGRRMRNAFIYDWRLWTLPELQELMLEAGFAATEVYIEGWDDDLGDTDGVFRRRKSYENQSGWVAYVVGLG